MIWDQNETGGKFRVSRREALEIRAKSLATSASRLAPRAFTLTELLVVITIIAILAGLITAAATGALGRAKQAAITLEIQQLSMALEEFKNKHGAYPPNVYPDSAAILGMTNNEKMTNAQDLLRAMKKGFNRSTEFQIDLTGSAPQRNATAVNDNLFPLIEAGLSPSEAVVFWLQGFSIDPARPLSGSDLELQEIDNFVTPAVGDTIFALTIDSRTPLFDFDRGRLRPTRFVLVARIGVANAIPVVLYEYFPSNSQRPYVYFDTSRRTPVQVVTAFPHNPDPAVVPGHEMFVKLSNNEVIVPLKKVKTGAPDPPTDLTQVEYVNQGKFQMLHPGTDDAWGNIGWSIDTNTNISQLNGASIPPLRFPTGPFIGDVADMVGNFGTGTLEDAQE